jgi:hypothetical protein
LSRQDLIGLSILMTSGSFEPKAETAVDQMNHSAQEKTSKRKELAK